MSGERRVLRAVTRPCGYRSDGAAGTEPAVIDVSCSIASQTAGALFGGGEEGKKLHKADSCQNFNDEVFQWRIFFIPSDKLVMKSSIWLGEKFVVVFCSLFFNEASFCTLNRRPTAGTHWRLLPGGWSLSGGEQELLPLRSRKGNSHKVGKVLLVAKNTSPTSVPPNSGRVTINFFRIIV